MTRKTTLAYMATTLAAIVVLVGLYMQSAARDPLQPAPAEPDAQLLGRLNVAQSPRNVPQETFMDGKGGEMRLSDLRGTPLLVNFWATWCAPCRKEMPSLSRLAELLREDGISVVTIASGPATEGANARFMAEIGVDNLPLYWDREQRLSYAMGILGLPVTVMINADGQEVARFTGDTEWDSPSAVSSLRALLLN